MSMYLGVYMCVVCKCVHMHVCVHAHTYTGLCVHRHEHLCMCACAHVYIHACVCVPYLSVTRAVHPRNELRNKEREDGALQVASMRSPAAAATLPTGTRVAKSRAPEG